MTKPFVNNTAGSILSLHKGEGPGFASLRLILSLTILIVHVRHLTKPGVSAGFFQAADHAVTNVLAAWLAPGFILNLSLVPAFFALSGFLVTGSAFRVRTSSTFLAFRALRIFPALLVEVTLSALLLGAIFTRLPLQNYYTDPKFFRYFGNIIGWISFYLPGVFEKSNAMPTVNANLWTLPSEFDCYFVTAALMLTVIAYKRLLITVIITVLVFITLNTLTNFAVPA